MMYKRTHWNTKHKHKMFVFNFKVVLICDHIPQQYSVFWICCKETENIYKPKKRKQLLSSLYVYRRYVNGELVMEIVVNTSGVPLNKPMLDGRIVGGTTTTITNHPLPSMATELPFSLTTILVYLNKRDRLCL